MAKRIRRRVCWIKVRHKHEHTWFHNKIKIHQTVHTLETYTSFTVWKLHTHTHTDPEDGITFSSDLSIFNLSMWEYPMHLSVLQECDPSQLFLNKDEKLRNSLLVSVLFLLSGHSSYMAPINWSHGFLFTFWCIDEFCYCLWGSHTVLRKIWS